MVKSDNISLKEKKKALFLSKFWSNKKGKKLSKREKKAIKHAKKIERRRLLKEKLSIKVVKKPYLHVYEKTLSIEIKMILWAQDYVKKIESLPKILKYVIGIFFILLGLLGIILPVLPGWAFFIPGVMLISKKFSVKMEKFAENYSAWKERLLESIKNIFKKSSK